MKQIVFSVNCGLLLFGCGTVGPDYIGPKMDLAPTFVASGSSALQNAAQIAWWQRLDDPLLNALVARATAQNFDVQSALERVVAANAAVGTTGANSQVVGSFGATIERQSRNDVVTTVRDAEVNAQYVIDLFGGYKRGQEQALANLDIAKLDVGTVRLALLADLTNSYLQARYYQEAAAITRRTIASRRRTLALVQQRLNVNNATQLELQQARSLLAAAEAPLPVLVANFEVNVFHIATLMAEPAGPLLQRVQSGARQPRPRGFTTVGLPADLLRNRPDVRTAERNLAAATAAIGVAEAALYPSVSLGGTLGTGTTDRWSFGPALSIPLLNRGVLSNRQLVAQSQAREAELDWRQSVLIAVEEVQSALTLCRNWYRQLQFLERAAAASGRVLTLSRESYEEGAVTLTEVLDAERVHAANRLAVADAIRNYTISWMQVQVATGKGWQAGAMAAPTTTVVASQ